MSEPRDAEGKGYGCACPSHDARMCVVLRYGEEADDQLCECPCHQWAADDEEFPISPGRTP